MGDGAGNFILNSTIFVGVKPYSVVSGDFNGDNKQDLAVANNGSGTVSIRFGDGLGGFTGSTNLTTGGGCSSVITGDFNSDGIKDLATANLNDNTISILAGDGIGSFNLVRNLTSVSSPIFITLGDFNGDGLGDITAGILNSSNVSIYSGSKSEINLLGNNISIPDGSVNVAASNNTDFGSVGICDNVSKTFKIKNSGNGSLTINSISLTGLNSSEFSIANITFGHLPNASSYNKSSQYQFNNFRKHSMCIYKTANIVKGF